MGDEEDRSNEYSHRQHHALDDDRPFTKALVGQRNELKITHATIAAAAGVPRVSVDRALSSGDPISFQRAARLGWAMGFRSLFVAAAFAAERIKAALEKVREQQSRARSAVKRQAAAEDEEVLRAVLEEVFADLRHLGRYRPRSTQLRLAFRAERRRRGLYPGHGKPPMSFDFDDPRVVEAWRKIRSSDAQRLLKQMLVWEAGHAALSDTGLENWLASLSLLPSSEHSETPPEPVGLRDLISRAQEMAWVHDVSDTFLPANPIDRTHAKMGDGSWLLEQSPSQYGALAFARLRAQPPVKRRPWKPLRLVGGQDIGFEIAIVVRGRWDIAFSEHEFDLSAEKAFDDGHRGEPELDTVARKVFPPGALFSFFPALHHRISVTFDDRGTEGDEPPEIPELLIINVRRSLLLGARVEGPGGETTDVEKRRLHPSPSVKDYDGTQHDDNHLS